MLLFLIKLLNIQINYLKNFFVPFTIDNYTKQLKNFTVKNFLFLYQKYIESIWERQKVEIN